MRKKHFLINIGLVFLCLIAIFINHFMEEDKMIGMVCMILMVVLGILNGNYSNKMK